VDKAQEHLDHAKETLAAAQDKQKLFTGKQPVAITAPLAGKVMTVHAAPGEFVAKSAPLITIADMTTLWVRVPIPEHIAPAVDQPAVEEEKPPVTIALKGGKILAETKPSGSGVPFKAKRLTMMKQVDVQKHTVDLIYELVPKGQAKTAQNGPPSTSTGDLPDKKHSTMGGKKTPTPIFLVKDQMVSVRVPVGPNKTEIVVPYAAVVFDNVGGSWIYVYEGKKTTGNHTVHRFKQQRVQLGPTVDSGVVIHVLQPGLDANDEIVVHGAAELFSSDYHSAPGTPAEDIDDDD
jgi:multidrug efflux pump subunit AcrA (membrane-fusion protein)